MKYDNFAEVMRRRLGSYFVVEDTESKRKPINTTLPAGWGTSPRRAPTAATYKPAHGGYPDKVKA